VRAVVWKAPYRVTVDEIEDPRIEAPTDAIMRLTTAAICGSDSHMYERRGL
jgi:glutathione-independent formaldehyde dehydrogenase